MGSGNQRNRNFPDWKSPLRVKQEYLKNPHLGISESERNQSFEQEREFRLDSYQVQKKSIDFPPPLQH